MHNIAVDIVFKAAHYLLLPDSQKEQPHVHNWQMRATVASRQLTDTGWVMDFHHLTSLLQETVEPLSAANCLNDLAEFQQANPTAEHLAQYIYEHLLKKIPASLQLTKVTVWETNSCRATYTKE
jgi:6-pyruvoyltetrahydropterin/6-carboxytetrahydropterin synthase